MPEFQLTTPVAFIIFNRPDPTERVFAEIARARPPKLLVVGDGPRANREDEAAKVAATRAIIKKVDWPCEVLTNFSETNLGCKIRVSSGLDWVFNNVDEAIILEDDCLPEQTFFRFCQEMLERYRNDMQIGMISGNNFQIDNNLGDDSYYFSKFVHIWGWATWSNRWNGHYDVEIKKWPSIRDHYRVADLPGSTKEEKYWKNIFDLVYNGHVDTWDYQWDLANWIDGRLTILPATNLISNIGFGSAATHTKKTTWQANLKTTPLAFPLTHPVFKYRNIKADKFTFKKCYDRSLLNKFFNKFKQLFNSI